MDKFLDDVSKLWGDALNIVDAVAKDYGTMWIALLGVVAVALVYWLVSQFFD